MGRTQGNISDREYDNAHHVIEQARNKSQLAQMIVVSCRGLGGLVGIFPEDGPGASAGRFGTRPLLVVTPTSRPYAPRRGSGMTTGRPRPSTTTPVGLCAARRLNTRWEDKL